MLDDLPDQRQRHRPLRVDPIRIIRDPYFGAIGRVADLPSEPQVLGSESRARVLAVTIVGDETVVVPRANVEIISE